MLMTSTTTPQEFFLNMKTFLLELCAKGGVGRVVDVVLFVKHVPKHFVCVFIGGTFL